MALVDTDNLLKRFSRYLRLERGLSENTIAGYMSDVEKLVDFIDSENLDYRSRFASVCRYITRFGYRCTVAGSYYFGDKIFFQFFENGEMHRYESFGIDRDS